MTKGKATYVTRALRHSGTAVLGCFIICFRLLLTSPPDGAPDIVAIVSASLPVPHTTWVHQSRQIVPEISTDIHVRTGDLSEVPNGYTHSPPPPPVHAYVWEPYTVAASLRPVVRAVYTARMIALPVYTTNGLIEGATQRTNYSRKPFSLLVIRFMPTVGRLGAVFRVVAMVACFNICWYGCVVQYLCTADPSEKAFARILESPNSHAVSWSRSVMQVVFTRYLSCLEGTDQGQEPDPFDQ